LDTGQYSQILDSIVIGDIFGCSDTQYNTNQTAVSTVHMPVNSERLFSSACDLHSDRRNRLSGHHADMLLFIKHNHRHHESFDIFRGRCYVIRYMYLYWYWVLLSLEANIIGYWVPFLVSF